MMRDCVILDQSGTTVESLQSLCLAHWSIHGAGSAPALRQVLAESRCDVGLVVFDTAASPDPQEVEAVLSRSATEWIAIVPHHALQDTAFRHFLLRTFRDYHTLPVDLHRLAVTIGHAYGMMQLRLTLDTDGRKGGRFGMIGQSPAMQVLFRQIEKVVQVDDPVLIGGESGTGKELVARAIHQYSRRRDAPLVAVDCGAIPANLIQSELFGFEKGAFTGAVQRRIGRIEAANGGVLFLDEIGNLPMEMQSNLLRFLQEKTIVRLGTTRHLPVDVRIIAATHVDLPRAVAAGTFREDLYYRLNVLRLEIPALRQRIGDIPLLAEGIFARLASPHSKLQVNGFSGEALRAMSAYHWPGNVRELINRIKRAMIMSESRLISATDVGLDGGHDQVRRVTLEDARSSMEKEVVESCLQANRNNVSRAARQLGVSRVTMYRMINRFGIILERSQTPPDLKGIQNAGKPPPLAPALEP